MHKLRTIRHTVGATLALAVAAAAPATAQDHGEHDTDGPNVAALYAGDAGTLGDKFIELAGAMSADQYTWRPMEGVRSVSEVYMLMAAEFYMVPSAWGAKAPEGIEAGPQLFQSLSTVTAKADVARHLDKSVAYYKQALGSLTNEDLHRTVTFFGRERPLISVLVMMTGDMHEHLGQAIAYARMNHVVPPWTARQNQN